MFVNNLGIQMNANKKCNYCNKPIINIYDHILVTHKNKINKFLAIKNHIKEVNMFDMNDFLFYCSIDEILMLSNN